MQKILRLNASTRSNRQQVIESVKGAIATSGGWILDFTMSSNLSVSIYFELAAEKMVTLRQALSKIDLQFNESSLLAISEMANLETAPAMLPVHLAATLQITFIHNEPDLRIPVPMIPG